MSSKDDVREASKQFYGALNRIANGESGSMAEIWSHSDAVTAMHPIGGREVGWEAVSASFDQVAKAASDGKVELRDQLIHVAGDLAYEMGVEHGECRMAGQPVNFEIRVTNIYERQAGAWKVIHHHTHITGDAGNPEQALTAQCTGTGQPSLSSTRSFAR